MPKKESWSKSKQHKELTGKGRKIRQTLLTVCVMAFIFAASAEKSQAYFTAYAVASGSFSVLAEMDTQLQEEFEGQVKTVRVENTGQTDCYVRVRAFSGSGIELVYEGDGWVKGAGDYWYYGEPLAAGKLTKPLAITIKKAEDTALPEEFEVAVVEEYTPVLYRDGIPYGEWGTGGSGAAEK